MNQEKETQQFMNHLRDLAQKSFGQNIYTFTGFLGLMEQSVFWQMERELRFAGCRLEGGFSEAERRVLRFGSMEAFGYDQPFPITCVHIEPLHQKFADELTHRDFLGALMNLGIERSTLGDIQISGKEAYLWCLESIADFICQNLEQVRHTNVKCAIADSVLEIPGPEAMVETVQVASLRIDALVAKVYNKSRGDCLELFRAGKVFVDGRLCENNARQVKAGESVTVRGFGKFRLSGEPYTTKKGKCGVSVEVFR